MRSANSRVHCRVSFDQCNQWSEGLKSLVLARWLSLSWLEHRPIYQEVAGSILGQSTYLGCGLQNIQETTNRSLVED